MLICRKAAREEFYDGDVFYNLARAEWVYKNRKRTVDVLLEGMKVDRLHSGMSNFKEEIRFRENSAITFLPRNNPINNFIGQFLRT